MKREIKITFTEGTGKDAITTEKVFKNLNNKDKRIMEYSTELLINDSVDYLVNETDKIADTLYQEITAEELKEELGITETKPKLTIQMVLEKAKELGIRLDYFNAHSIGHIWFGYNNEIINMRGKKIHYEDISIASVEGIKINHKKNASYLKDEQITLINWIKENANE